MIEHNTVVGTRPDIASGNPTRRGFGVLASFQSHAELRGNQLEVEPGADGRRHQLADRRDALGGALMPHVGVPAGRCRGLEDSLFRESGVGFDEMLRFVGEFRRYLESLPADRFPNLVELAGPLTRISPDQDERFEFMLKVIVDGLAAQR